MAWYRWFIIAMAVLLWYPMYRALMWPNLVGVSKWMIEHLTLVTFAIMTYCVMIIGITIIVL